MIARKKLGPGVGAVLVVVAMAIACRDASEPRTNPPAMDVVPCDGECPDTGGGGGGGDGSQSTDVTWSFTGGYPGYEEADGASRSVTFHLDQSVSSGALYTNLSFPYPTQAIGNAPAVDIASTSSTPSSGFGAVTNFGANYSAPSVQTLQQNVRVGDETNPYQPNQAPHRLAGAALAASAIAPRTGVGRFVTPAGAAATLAQLRAMGGTEVVDADGVLRFTVQRAGLDYAFRFSPLVGATIEIRESQAGQLKFVTTRDYRLTPRGQHLVGQTTVSYGPDGTPRNTMRMTFAQ